jgi:hypothetical protein
LRAAALKVAARVFASPSTRDLVRSRDYIERIVYNAREIGRAITSIGSNDGFADPRQ